MNLSRLFFSFALLGLFAVRCSAQIELTPDFVISESELGFEVGRVAVNDVSIVSAFPNRLAHYFDASGVLLGALAPDPPSLPRTGSFGTYVAGFGTTALVSGRSYDAVFGDGLFGGVFVYDMTTGMQTHRFLAERAPSRNFGVEADLNDKYVAVGNHAGEVFVFNLDTDELVDEFDLLNIDARHTTTLSLHDNFLAVGHPYNPSFTSPPIPEMPQGVFVIDLETSEIITEITRPDIPLFAQTLELLNDSLLVGGPGRLLEYSYAGDLLRAIDVSLDPFSFYEPLEANEEYIAVASSLEEEGFPIRIYDRDSFELIATAAPPIPTGPLEQSQPWVIDLHENRLAVSVTGTSPSISVFTIPEPIVPAGIYVLLFLGSCRLTRRASMSR